MYPRKLDAKNSVRLATLTDPQCLLEDLKEFVIQVDNSFEIKESKKLVILLDVGGELKKIWNMRWTVIEIADGAMFKMPGNKMRKQNVVDGDQRKSRSYSDQRTVGID